MIHDVTRPYEISECLFVISGLQGQLLSPAPGKAPVTMQVTGAFRVVGGLAYPFDCTEPPVHCIPIAGGAPLCYTGTIPAPHRRQQEGGMQNERIRKMLCSGPGGLPAGRLRPGPAAPAHPGRAAGGGQRRASGGTPAEGR